MPDTTFFSAGSPHNSGLERTSTSLQAQTAIDAGETGRLLPARLSQLDAEGFAESCCGA